MTDREPVDVTKEQLTVLCVKPGEKPKRIEIESSLDALQRAVGGYIEAVYPYEDPVALIVNEEGKLNGLPLNRALRDEDKRTVRAVQTNGCCCIGKRHSICQCLPQFRS